MKCMLSLLFTLFSLSSFSQTTDTLKIQPVKESDTVSFTSKVDIANATKDGIYLNDYVVNISYKQLKKLNGKKIKVTGKVTIIKGLQNLNKDEIQQGREADTKYIQSPKIEIISN